MVSQRGALSMADGMGYSESESNTAELASETTAEWWDLARNMNQRFWLDPRDMNDATTISFLNRRSSHF